jgi:ATP-dependent DNA ligase
MSDAESTASANETRVGEESSTGGETDAQSHDDEPPPCDRTNSLPFYRLCNRLEDLWSIKRQRNVTKTEEERKKHLLPPKMLKKLEGQSLFPLFRLIMPDYDTSRSLYMKEKLIAQAYCEVIGFVKGSKNYEMLYEYTNQSKLVDCPELAGDISLIVEHILAQRISTKPSNITVGQVNDLLDELMVMLQRNRGSFSHEWRQKSSNTTSSKDVSVKKRREQWLRKVMNRGLSPREHKWLVRILLKKMEFGLGAKSILNYYSRFANQLYESHNSLKNLCEKLADPAYTVALEAERARKKAAEDSSSADYRWEPQDQPALLGNVISPMRPIRVSFENCMAKLQQNHQEYVKSLPASAPLAVRNSLALQFPAICVEVKLDGERMLYHIENGVAAAQTRNGKLYSRIYSPVLGPALRKALSKYRVNVIFDGEVESWDNGRKHLIPFGSNRTVAINRQFFMKKHGLLENLDQKLHENPDGSITDPNVQLVGDALRFLKDQSEKLDTEYEPGKDCWLQYLIFDILYVDGPDAKRLFQDCLMDDSAMKPGSLAAYTLVQRKIILHQLITPQPRQVEISRSIVIRPNGDCVKAEEYFLVRPSVLDVAEHHPAFLDSTQAAIQQALPDNILELDRKRRKGRSDFEISRLRTEAVTKFYNQIVEEQKMEGLVFKDLASPYIFGQASKNRKFWHKFKPDYDGGETIDVVILGAFFATGLRHSGELSHFLCGVIDDDHPDLFIPVLNVNGKSTTYDNLAKILDITGYRKATPEHPLELGKWEQRDAEHDGVPDFISHRSFQDSLNDESEGGWAYSKSSFPDLWIRPEDSIVLELKGQEFIRTPEYPSGLTMRFPRIKRIRHELMDGDPKSAYEVDTHNHIRQLHYLTLLSRQGGQDNNSFSPIGSSSTLMIQKKFLTTEEFARAQQHRKRKKRPLSSPSKVPKVEHVLSNALKGISFTVLEGNYSLDYEGLEAHDAKDNGWFQEASAVKRKEDVMFFIKSHGGSVKVSVDGDDDTIVVGGGRQDARVVNYMRGIQNARAQLTSSKSKSKKLSKIQSLATKEGVLKWTYVYSVVHRWLAGRSSPSSSSLKDSDAGYMQPKVHDYLARSTTQQGSNDHAFDLGNSSDVTKMDMLRLLEEYGASESNSKSASSTWQEEMISSFEPQDRWIFRSPIASSNLGEGLDRTVLYADIFDDVLGKAEESGSMQEFQVCDSGRWQQAADDVETEELRSVLPLASAMGATVSPYLHAHVTHVLKRRSNVQRNRGVGAIKVHLDRLGTSETTLLVEANHIVALWDEQHPTRDACVAPSSDAL